MSSALFDDLQAEISRTKTRMRVRHSLYDGAWLLCLLMGTVNEASYLENVRAAGGNMRAGKTEYWARFDKLDPTLVRFINQTMHTTREIALGELDSVFDPSLMRVDETQCGYSKHNIHQPVRGWCGNIHSTSGIRDWRKSCLRITIHEPQGKTRWIHLQPVFAMPWSKRETSQHTCGTSNYKPLRHDSFVSDNTSTRHEAFIFTRMDMCWFSFLFCSFDEFSNLTHNVIRILIFRDIVYFVVFS